MPSSSQTRKNPTRSLISVEAGLQSILTRMTLGKFKVFSTLNDWHQERRMYHRENGVVVKLFDDLMSATRYAYLDLRFAETDAPLERSRRYRNWKTA